jgi:quercetin dioxygenase-like cupin family protein
MPDQRLHPVTERPLDAPLLIFDLAAVLMQIKHEVTWKTGTRNGMTLLKGPGLRVVLVTLHPRTVLPFHRADSPLSVQILEGKLTFRTEAQAVTLSKGHLLTLHAGIPHTMEAIEETAFLLTLATETAHPVELSRHAEEAPEGRVEHRRVQP